MKRTFRLFLSLFIMTVMFFGASVKVNATEIPNQITVTGFQWLGSLETASYGIFAVEPSGGTHAYCLDADRTAPTSGVLNLFDLNSVFSYAQINKMVAVLRTSGDPEFNLGLSETDSFYVTQAALWYARYGGAGVAPLTDNFNNFLKTNSTYSSAYNKLLNAINEANNGKDFTKTSNSIAINAVSGNPTQSMKEVEISGKKYLLSDSTFKVSAPGNYTITVNGGYLATASGDNTGKTSATYSTSDTFRIIIPVDDSKSGSASATFTATTVDSYITSYSIHGYQSLTSSGLQRLILLFKDKEKLSINYSVKGDYSKSTEVKIAKVNKENKLVAGAKLGIYDENGNLINSYDSKTDYITVTLGEGKYYLKEISAPSGYLLSDEKVYFSINKDGSVLDNNGNVVTTKTFTITDELPTINIRKVNEKGVAVKNAKIVICSYDVDTKKESNCDFEWITDGTVKQLTIGVDFGFISDGSYVIKEVEAPHGFEMSEPKYITVKDGKLYGDLQKDTVTLVDVSYLDVSKTDATGQNEIAGANMKLLDKDGNLVEEWVSTTSEHRIHGLNTGEIYEIIESLAPNGYVPLETSISFVLNEDGSVTTCNISYDSNNNKVCDAMSQDEILKIKNDVTKIKISKVDITNQEELPGATLQILNTDGSPVYQNGEILEWVSTNEPHYIEMLPVGEYKLVETFSPAGYVAVSNEVYFEVKAETGIQTVVFENDVTKVLISKRDFTTGEEIEGAHLQILDKNGIVVEEWISGKEPHYIEKLSVGEYTLIETLPADGYQEGMIVDGMLTTAYSFEVKDNMLLKIDVYNEVISVPNTGLNVSSTYIIGSMTMFIGLGTITFARKKGKEVY